MWMARSEDGDEIWGTWEELLLASAVSRLGAKDWGSVAAAVGERTAFAHLLTAEVCEQRYRDLCHRFQGEGRPRDGDGHDALAIPWLDDLRRLRVAELRREVQRHDVSIVSLQSKVKKLTEERERSAGEGGGAGGGDAAEPEGSHRRSNGTLLPEPAAAAGERSGRSCNESNSPESKEEGREGREKKPPGDAGTPPAAAAGDPAARGEDKAPGEGSCNGSSETVVMGKGGAEAVAAADDAGGAPAAGAPDSGESMAESTGEETATKDSSDVQSSASPSRRRKRGGRRKPGSAGGSAAAAAASGGNSEGDSPAPKVDLSGKSQPLVVLLEIIRSHKYGSVFERRHESQDSSRYRSLIRQHMDLETVGKKLEDGGAYTVTEFFRDLFLLCANAAVFFPKDSSEHNAAAHLRKLLHKEYASLNQKPASLSPPPDVPAVLPPPVAPVVVAAPRPPAPPRQPQLATSKPKNEPEPLTSFLEKVPPTPPLSACRKRSSLSAKAASVKAVKEEVPPPPPPAEEKSDAEKEPESAADKKVVKEKPVARGLRTTKTRGPMMKKPTLPILEAADPKPRPESKDDGVTEPAKPLADKKSGNSNAGGSMEVQPAVPVAKKRSAAGFLNRLKGAAGAASPSNGEKAQPAKNVEAGGITRSAGVDQRKGSRDERRKEKPEPSGPPKRSVGRPPKRPPPTPPSQPPAKRAREAEAEAPAAAAKKRGRR